MPAWAGKISKNANRALHSSMGSSKSVIIQYIFSKLPADLAQCLDKT